MAGRGYKGLVGKALDDGYYQIVEVARGDWGEQTNQHETIGDLYIYN